MLLLSNLFNPNNPDMHQSSDSFIDLIKQLKDCEIPKITFVKSVKLSHLSSLSVFEAKQFIENKGCIMFEIEYQRIKLERDNLISFCSEFYTNINQEYCKDGLIHKTLQEIIYELNQWEVRLKRMLCILKPKFNITDGFNKPPVRGWWGTKALFNSDAWNWLVQFGSKNKKLEEGMHGAGLRSQAWLKNHLQDIQKKVTKLDQAGAYQSHNH